jgi:hypothetical protein
LHRWIVTLSPRLKASRIDENVQLCEIKRITNNSPFYTVVYADNQKEAKDLALDDLLDQVMEFKNKKGHEHESGNRK